MSSKLFIDTPHLVFQPHETQVDTSLDINQNEVLILRELGKKYAEIASLSIQDKRKNMWKKLNNLD